MPEIYKKILHKGAKAQRCRGAKEVVDDQSAILDLILGIS